MTLDRANRTAFRMLCRYEWVGEMTINPGSAKVTCKEP
jgi:hypothetical protein